MTNPRSTDLVQSASMVEAPETTSLPTTHPDDPWGLTVPAGPDTWVEWRDKKASEFFGREVTNEDALHMLDVLWHWAREQRERTDRGTPWTQALVRLELAIHDTRVRISQTSAIVIAVLQP